MKSRVFFRCAGLGAMVVLLAAVPALPDPIENGDFSDGLNGWTVEYGTVTDGGGYAFFEEDPIDSSSTLSQEFTIPTWAPGLWFDVQMSAVVGGDDYGFPPDAFTASLLDPVTLDPLISNPGYTDFYYLDNTGYVETVGSVSGNTVYLDVSTVLGMDVLLSFDLWGGDDGMVSTVNLDNVAVPAPSALLLGIIGIGSGSAGLWRRVAKNA